VSLRLYWLKESVSYLRYVSEKYAPNVVSPGHQIAKIKEEAKEVFDAYYSGEGQRSDFVARRKANAAKECADVIIAAARLGTMLSPDFAQVILDKGKELNEREPLK